jgi:DNA invertase Pin-like site-specific DNA recombinase
MTSNLHPKIADHHLTRAAYIYIRQSSQGQVLRNKESQINQYQLAERAQQLGWDRERIRVIDMDLGLSGKESASRNGFQELVAEVSLGHAGIIFGYEVSRLARNNSDWYHLLDLAAIFNTLIADHDGIYDPRQYNDRLLLGLKGTMSEAELHMLKMRMEEGRLRQIERGAYRQVLPTGLVRLPNGSVVKDPDDQIRHILELVFTKFEELGSCRQVLLYLQRNDIRLPRRQTYGPQVGEIIWKVASHAGVYAILRNPAYAGAFVFGKTYLDPARRKAGRKDTGIVHRDFENWPYVHQNIYPAYIAWEQFLQNQRQLRQNAVRFDQATTKAGGPVRRGPALLQGMVICAACGYHKNVIYNPFPRYICQEKSRLASLEGCKSLPATVIDAAVVEQFFAAIQPAQLDALEALLQEQHLERGRLTQQWEERKKRAQYEARLAERQYKAVDPDNRLVAAELERRWEEKLRELQETQEGYDRFLQTPLAPTIPPELREQFRQIAQTLPQLWQSGQLTVEQKKELLRSLISCVVLKRTQANTIEIKIIWVSGHYSLVTAHPPIYRTNDIQQLDQMTEQIHRLWQQGRTDDEIAEQLSTEGFRSPRSRHLLPATVQRIRLAQGWKTEHPKMAPRLQLAGYLSITDLANELHVSRSRVSRWIHRQVIPATEVVRHPVFKSSYLIRSSDPLLENLRQELVHSRRLDKRI